MPARASSQAEQAAGEAERHAFGEQRARQPAAARAQRNADGELPPASLGPHEKQIRHVGAGDHQHDSDRAQENPQHAPHVADHVLRQRTDIRPQPYRLFTGRGGNRSNTSGIMRATSSFAWAIVTPGLSRAIAL